MVEVEALQADLEELRTSFVRAAREAWLVIDPSLIETEFIPAPHKPPAKLPRGKQAVYCFFFGNTCLKVGKAGPKTQARFTHQHYSATAAPSTLARSILLQKNDLKLKLPARLAEEIDALDDRSVGNWLKQNTTRIHVYLPEQWGDLALSLLELFLQVRYKPLCEGERA
jgi:hypothetical protein